MVRYIRYCPSETTATEVKRQALREVQFFIQALGNKQTAQSNMPLLTPSKYLLKNLDTVQDSFRPASVQSVNGESVWRRDEVESE